MRSQYRARWYGVVIAVAGEYKYKGQTYYTLWVEMVYDKRGKPMRRRKRVVYAESHFKIVSADDWPQKQEEE